MFNGRKAHGAVFVAKLVKGVWVRLWFSSRRFMHFAAAIYTSKPLQLLLGKMVRFRYSASERLILQRSELNQDLSGLGVIRQTFVLGRKLILWLIILGTTSSVLDSFIFQLLTTQNVTEIGLLSIFVTENAAISPVNNTIFQLTEIYIGIIATILGLLFALYVVGFELTTQKYSRDVAQFINTETVGSLFFQWLLFALLFNCTIVVRLWFTQVPVLVSFTISTALTAYSLFTILIYRSHHVLASRPENVIWRLLSEYRKALVFVADRKSVFYDSPSISGNARNIVIRMSGLVSRIYVDLLKNEDVAVASITPTVIAHMLADYARVKHRIRTENTN